LYQRLTLSLMLREYRINALIIVLLIAAAHALPESTQYTNDDEWQEAVMAQDMVARGTDSAYDEIWDEVDDDLDDEKSNDAARGTKSDRYDESFGLWVGPDFTNDEQRDRTMASVTDDIHKRLKKTRVEGDSEGLPKFMIDVKLLKITDLDAWSAEKPDKRLSAVNRILTKYPNRRVRITVVGHGFEIKDQHIPHHRDPVYGQNHYYGTTPPPSYSHGADWVGSTNRDYNGVKGVSKQFTGEQVADALFKMGINEKSHALVTVGACLGAINFCPFLAARLRYHFNQAGCSTCGQNVVVKCRKTAVMTFNGISMGISTESESGQWLKSGENPAHLNKWIAANPRLHASRGLNVDNGGGHRERIVSFNTMKRYKEPVAGVPQAWIDKWRSIFLRNYNIVNQDGWSREKTGAMYESLLQCWSGNKNGGSGACDCMFSKVQWLRDHHYDTAGVSCDPTYTQCTAASNNNRITFSSTNAVYGMSAAAFPERAHCVSVSVPRTCQAKFIDDYPGFTPEGCVGFDGATRTVPSQYNALPWPLSPITVGDKLRCTEPTPCQGADPCGCFDQKLLETAKHGQCGKYIYKATTYVTSSTEWRRCSDAGDTLLSNGQTVAICSAHGGGLFTHECPADRKQASMQATYKGKTWKDSFFGANDGG